MKIKRTHEYTINNTTTLILDYDGEVTVSIIREPENKDVRPHIETLTIPNGVIEILPAALQRITK